ncbi:MAG: hypothetical protein MK085_02355 [Phycisphaerales bacterium]|nr:hypothetical protein [Phycisphaerales bacterium]
MTAPDAIYNEIDDFVKELNRKSENEPARETLIFPLKLARAMDLSAALDKLYPEPPMPLDSRGRPLPHLQKPREVFVSADEGTNTLIIEAPAERKMSFEALVEQLDRVELPPQAEIRTWKILDMDGGKVVSTLQGLASKGVLSRAGDDGGKAVEVSIEFEPQSRTLIVAGDAFTFKQVEEILDSLGSDAHMPQTTMQVFRLQQARAESVADMLRGILVARIVEDIPGIEGEADAQRMLKITADRKTNIIILMAPAALMPVAEELIQALDTSAAAVGEATVRVRPLTFADAGVVAQSLQQAIPNMTSEATGDPLEVKVVAAPGSNALLLIGLSEDISEVDALIEPLDARPAMDAIDARTFALQYADASSVAPLVERLLTDQQESDPRLVMERIRRSRGMIDLTPPVRVEAEQRTNSLIVSGPQQTVALAESLITQIDRPDEDAQRTYATFTPRQADVDRLLENARRLLDATRPAGTRSTLELLQESQSGAILVVGSEEETQRALKLLAQWDAEAPEIPQMDLRIVNIEHAEAGVVANAVQGLLRDRSRWPMSLLEASRAGIAFAEPSVVVDGQSNRVLVVAPASLMGLSQELITQLDRPISDETLVMQVHAVPPGDAAEVATALQSVLKSQEALRPGEPPATVVAAPGANVVVVSATAKRQAAIAGELEKFNIAMGAAQVRTMFLKHSVAEKIAPLVEKMLAQEEMYDPNDIPSWMRRSFMGSQQNSGESALRVVADTRLNAVVVAGPPAVLNAAEQIVGQLDVAASNATVRSVRVLAIRNADAGDVAESLEALFADAEDGEPAPVIRVNRSSNTLLVRASAAQFTEIRTVASEIDEAAVQVAREIRTLSIDPTKGSAASIARMLEQMLDRPDDDRVRIVPLEDLIKMSDPEPEEEDEPDNKVSRAPTGTGLNPHAAAIFAAAFAQVASEDETEEDPAEVVVAVDPETNSLIIVGAPRELQRFAELAEQAEAELPAEGSIVRSVPLPESVDVKSVASVVKQTLAMMIPAGGKRNDLSRRAAIIPDTSTHSLFIACQRGDLELISQVVAAAARPAVAEKVVVRVYRFTDASAERAATGLNGLLANARSPRFQELAITIDADGRTVESTFDPAAVRAFPDVSTNTLVVVAPSDALPFVDRFVELSNQAEDGERTTLKLFKLQHARAADMQRTLSKLFTVRFRNLRRTENASVIEPDFAVDERSNILLVTASVEELAEVETLLAKLDVEAASEQYPLEVIELEIASPRTAASIIDEAVLGADGSLRSNTLVVPDEQAGVLLVRADKTTLTEIKTVLEKIDRDSTNRFPVRSIQLERADAGEVARAIERFYDDRARISSAGRGRRSESRRVAITGRPGGGTLLVACDDTDFEEIQGLVKTFDSVDAERNATYRIFPLQHARAGDVAEMVRQLVGELIFTDDFNPNRRGDGPVRSTRGSVSVLADERLNALVVTGGGDHFELVEEVVASLDATTPENERRVVRYYRFPNIDTDVLEDVLEEATETNNTSRGWWNRRSSGGKIEIINDYASGTILVVGNEQQQQQVVQIIDGLREALSGTDRSVEVIRVEYADAGSAASAVGVFVEERNSASGGQSGTVVIPVDNASMILVSGTPEEIALVKDLVAKIDRPDLDGDRSIEIIALERGDAGEIARLAGEQFARRGGDGVIITADVRTNSLLVNAPSSILPQVLALVNRLDAPDDTTESVIRTYNLQTARADDVVQILSDTLRLDGDGRTDGISIMLEDAPEGAPPVEVRATITADQRSNSLVVTATEESLPVIESIIAQLEQSPAQSPIEYRIITLEYAPVTDLSWTLTNLLRARGEDWIDVGIEYNRVENQLIIGATSDQFEVINEILAEIDVPSELARRTDFVALNFADAAQLKTALDNFYGAFAPEADTPGKQNVRIIADEATNSLVITAPESEWPDIQELVTRLDSEEYDASLQLRVVPLTYADARSVARAINDAFRPIVTESRRENSRSGGRSNEGGGSGERDDRGDRRGDAPTVMMKGEEWVSASAEPQTNAVIISANRQNMLKIERIIEQIDVAEFAKLPPPRLIPVTSGDPMSLADALRRMYVSGEEARGGMALRIIGDKASNAIIVRADPDEFAQIVALAEALQQNAESNGLSVRVLQLADAPAARVAESIRQAFLAKAQQAGVPLAIQVDAAGNALVVASTGPFFDEIEAIVRQMDRLAPAAGQGIFIIELEHVPAESAERAIRRIGLDKPQPADSTSRLVVEPIKLSRMDGRNALLVVANPADRETIVGILKAIDGETDFDATDVQVIPLQRARADSVADMIAAMIDPSEQQSGSPLAVAVKEQVRRLNIARGDDAEPLELDLDRPIRVIPDVSANSLVISSSRENVLALVEVVKLFDRLPASEAVTMRIFPLENMAAERFVSVVEDLFSRGTEIARVPGLDIETLPDGNIGPALLQEVAMAIDDRTNTVVVAGKDSAVALVEVLRDRLDSEIGTGWVEPRVITLRYADAENLAQLIQSVVIDGANELPGSSPLQEQVARLRALGNGGNRAVESEIFVPLSRLFVYADPQLNALVVVGSPPNIALINELVTMMDVEAAAPSALVRVYPVRHGSAERLSSLISQLFDQQFSSKAIREEDRLKAVPDARTNSIVVSTSTRSFAIFEQLLEKLDSPLSPEFREIRVIPLATASAARLAPMIQQLMDARLERLRIVQPKAAEFDKALVLADTRSNTLVVAAGAESFEVISRLVIDLDLDDLGEAAQVHVIPVTRGGLDRIAQAVNQVMDRRYADLPTDIANRQKPLVMTDPRTSSLMVAAAPEDLRAIKSLVNQLAETPSNPAISLEVISLETARVSELAPRIQAVMRERRESLGDAATDGDRVSVEVDAASNSLIIAANAENQEVVRDLVKVLAEAERERIGDQSFEILAVSRNRATELLELVNDLYVDSENSRRGKDSVRVSADSRLNAILASGTPEDIEAIRSLVERLDTERPGAVVEVRYVPLSSANVLETVSLIESVLNGGGGRRGSNAQAGTILRYLQKMEGAEGEIEGDGVEVEVSSAIRDSIALTPDVRTNTVIVTAPQASMELIVQMINDLDNSSVGSKRIEVFKLVNADASATAELLTELFQLRQQGNLYVLKPREEIEVVDPGAAMVDIDVPAVDDGGMFGTDLTMVPDERQALSITVDSRTNSLIVSGTPAYLELVSKVVTDLDTQETNIRDTYVYQLRNAQAAEVARVVSEFVAEDQRKFVETLSNDQLPSAARLLEREVTIVGDAKSNTVLVNASPQYMQEVRSIIEDLDVDPPQVLIEVMIAEVTLDNENEAGVTMDGKVGVVPVKGNIEFKATDFFTQPVVGSFSMGLKELSLVFSALQAQGRVQVLSNPSITVANNEDARIQVGQTLRVPDSISTLATGTQTSSITPEQIGTILEVRPSINPDGFVRLDVRPTISRLEEKKLEITPDFKTPIITRREATTTVTVKDGETIVLGGLIEETLIKLDRKIPLLADIPLIGGLFRHEVQDSTRREVLIVITPHVMTSPGNGQLRDASIDAIDKLPMRDDVKEEFRDGSLRGSGGVFDAEYENAEEIFE